MLLLQDSRAIFNVIGGLLRKPDLLLECKYQLNLEDFPQRFHKIIFGSIKQLYNKGTQKIDSTSIDCYLANYKEQYKIFEQNNGLEYLNEAIDLCNIDLFNYNAKRIKKFTLLRKLEEDNFNIAEVYNEKDEELLKQFDESEPDDLINHFTKKLIEIEKDIVNAESGSHISEGLDELITDLENNPVMGYNCGINALNYYLYGLRKKYYLFSARSGIGKTRLQVFFCLQLGYHQNIPCLFYSTELPKDEIQSMMIAYIANISERKILMNNLTPEERIKKNEAKEKLKKSNIYIIYEPDFNLEKVENTIKRYILSKKIGFVFFDYIKESISMIEGINKRVGKIDGWKALNLFSERLKALVEKYKVGIMSATQLNKDGSTSGSSAIPNSVDVWCEIRGSTKEEKEKFNLDFEAFNENEEIITIENKKNRRGLKDFFVFLKTDLGKLYYKELSVAKNDNPIKVPTVKFTE